MARLAIDLGNVVGMRVLLDIGMAVITLQAAVDAGAELVAVDGNAVAGRILHRLVAMTGEAISLRCKVMWRKEDHEGQKAERGCYVKSSMSAESEQQSDWTGNNCDEERCETCGFGHAAVFPTRSEQSRSRTRLPQRIFRLH